MISLIVTNATVVLGIYMQYQLTTFFIIIIMADRLGLKMEYLENRPPIYEKSW